MRRLILALMIVLLPLRGWMGDAMAMDAASDARIATELVAENHHSTMDFGHHEAKSGSASASGDHGHCLDHASATAPAPAATPTDPTGESPADDSDHGGSCTACQVCHSVAMNADVPRLPALPLPAAAPATFLASFSSAEPAPGLKPPIS